MKEDFLITHDNLPLALSMLFGKVLRLETIIIEQAKIQATTDQWFDLDELCNYHPDKPRKQTGYGWVHAGLIPCHKGGKKLRFLKSEIDDWLKQGRKKTLEETSKEADHYLAKKKGGCHA